MTYNKQPTRPPLHPNKNARSPPAWPLPRRGKSNETPGDISGDSPVRERQDARVRRSGSERGDEKPRPLAVSLREGSRSMLSRREISSDPPRASTLRLTRRRSRPMWSSVRLSPPPPRCSPAARRVRGGRAA